MSRVTPPSGMTEAHVKAAMEFAMDAISRIPKGSRDELEAHLTGVLVVFMGALWGSFGTEYAHGFIDAQLRGMEPGVPNETFIQPRVQ